MKKNCSLILLIAGLFFCVSCNRQKQASATIFERKEMDSGRLLIKYNYTVDGISYVDSANIENQIIGSDTINVKFSNSTPGQSIPAIEK